MYEVIDKYYFIDSIFSQMILLKNEDNSIEARGIPRKVKITLGECRWNKDCMHK